MDADIARLVRNMEKQPGASDALLRKLLKALNVNLPDQFLDFLRFANGAEGWIGEEQNSYLVIYSVDDLLDSRRAYLDAGAPEWLVLFGASGGGSGYGFDTRSNALPVIETDWCFELFNVRGRTFLEFLQYLASQAPYK